MMSRQPELAKIILEMPFGDLIDLSRNLLANIKAIQEEDQFWHPDTEDRIAHLLHGWADNENQTEGE